MNSVRRRDTEVVAGQVARAQRARRLAPLRPHPISAAIDPVTAPDTPLVIVPEAVSAVEHLFDGRLRLDLRDTTVTIPAAAAGLLGSRLEAEDVTPWCARDLTPALSADASIRLVATLLSEGVITVRQS